MKTYWKQLSDLNQKDLEKLLNESDEIASRAYNNAIEHAKKKNLAYPHVGILNRDDIMQMALLIVAETIPKINWEKTKHAPEDEQINVALAYVQRNLTLNLKKAIRKVQSGMRTPEREFLKGADTMTEVLMSDRQFIPEAIGYDGEEDVAYRGPNPGFDEEEQVSFVIDGDIDNTQKSIVQFETTRAFDDADTMLEDCFMTLTDEEIDLLTLKYGLRDNNGDGVKLKSKEIAEQFGYSVSKVDTTMNRIRNKLKNNVELSYKYNPKLNREEAIKLREKHGLGPIDMISLGTDNLHTEEGELTQVGIAILKRYNVKSLEELLRLMDRMPLSDLPTPAFDGTLYVEGDQDGEFYCEVFTR
tara:strand:+ start:462 stop:1535 length:1074 start_codon:yes stop_codon:yes gene_type:complete